jgi:hypothetical protein
LLLYISVARRLFKFLYRLAIPIVLVLVVVLVLDRCSSDRKRTTWIPFLSNRGSRHSQNQIEDEDDDEHEDEPLCAVDFFPFHLSHS